MEEEKKVRSSGQTASEEVASEQVDDVDQPTELKEERTLSLTRAFRRMRTDWNGPDRDVVDRVLDDVNKAIFDRFSSAYALMYEIWDIVRFTEVNEDTGEVVTDSYGVPLWQRLPDGTYKENWDNIGRKQRERLLYQLTTRMFEWESTAADIWGEALLAKSQFEEAFATGFDTADSAKKTIEARTAAGNRTAASYRYLAVYKSLYSRKADALVRSMVGLSQRLKDLHIA